MLKQALVAVSVALFMTACADMSSTRSSSASTSPAPSSSASGSTASSSTASSKPAAVKRDRLENIALVWKPTTDTAKLRVMDLTAMTNTKVQINKLSDKRPNPGYIGENSEEQPIRKVSTPDDVAGFVTEHMKRLTASAGIPVVDSGGTAIVNGELLQFFTQETDTYRGDVQMKITVTDTAGKVRWTGMTSGGSTRFGRSYKAENYYESLSDALIEAMYNLLQNADFRKALASN